MVSRQESLATVIEVLVYAFIISFASKCSAHFCGWLFLSSKAWHEILVGIFSRVHFQLFVLGFKFKL